MKDFIDEIREYVPDIHPYDNGRRQTGACPICSRTGQKGRLVADPYIRMWKCCDCGAYGSLPELVARLKRISFSEAVTVLKEGKEPEVPEAQKLYWQMNRTAAIWFAKNLFGKTGKTALAYFKERQLTEDTMRKFGLGYGGSSSTALYKHMKGQGYTDDQLKESGLFNISDDGGIYDRFRGRVMFPIMDRYGHVIAFGGRILDDNAKTCKYLNSPESEWFKKGKHLYAGHLARYSRKNFLMLCEGYMDVIALHQAGYDNAVASLGTSLTELQSMVVSSMSNTVIVTYDSDEAGEKAARRAIPMLRKHGTRTKWFSMLPAKDPDEYMKTFGKDAFDALISEAPYFVCDENGNFAIEK